jgi:hypothetical protein
VSRLRVSFLVAKAFEGGAAAVGLLAAGPVVASCYSPDPWVAVRGPSAVHGYELIEFSRSG